ncbi:uncharacterized protein DC041_0011741 [Schistosoma bovis]|uniref:Leishmanolysin-like peptidase n=1 Tax=Schistosoma bovis TaxID=6184 RepID=A0A430PZ37_SCHBO|nr:uncharacterized protein DC041_0011741 [Schistosoma bovis]
MKSCYEFIKNRKRRGQDIQPFCDKPDEVECFRSENTQSYCDLYKHEVEMKPEFQYMDNSFNVPVDERKYYGGFEKHDYCPVLDVSYHSLYRYYCRKHYDTVLYVRCLLKGN